MLNRNICHYCGHELNEFDLQEEFVIQTIPGYGSNYDMEEISLRLCCDCFDKLVEECAISPVVTEEY